LQSEQIFQQQSKYQKDEKISTSPSKIGKNHSEMDMDRKSSSNGQTGTMVIGNFS
jgi:hypothetical protein